MSYEDVITDLTERLDLMTDFEALTDETVAVHLLKKDHHELLAALDRHASDEEVERIAFRSMLTLIRFVADCLRPAEICMAHAGKL